MIYFGAICIVYPSGVVVRATGTFKGWLPQRGYGFVRTDAPGQDVFIHCSEVKEWWNIRAGARLEFEPVANHKGLVAMGVSVISAVHIYAGKADELLPGDLAQNTASEKENQASFADDAFVSEDIEEHNPANVNAILVREVATWKREAKAEDSHRYFWHVGEVDQIAKGDAYFVIGRKGTGKTAICEHLNQLQSHDVFAEKLSFKNFPFNELYLHKNTKYTNPNQFISIWKYLIYSSVCRLMLKNQALDSELREKLSSLYDDDTPLSRRVNRWVGKEFGISLFGLSFKINKNTNPKEPTDWTQHVDFLEDLLRQHAIDDATYFILFDELDEDYRDVIGKEQYEQYTSLITSLFKAVQDIRTTFQLRGSPKIFPVIFLRDDIYDIIKDSDKNKWGDFRVDLNWDVNRTKRLIAFRLSRALDAKCTEILSFEDAWAKLFGSRRIGVGDRRKQIGTFEFISRSTLLRPRDFVAYLQNCAKHAMDNQELITPNVVRYVDKAFSNYLRQELTDELFAIIPDIENIFDAISQLRKWNFSIPELEQAYTQQVERGFIQDKNVKFVLQVLFLFSAIGNSPRSGRYVFRYQNREARLNFNERVVVHRGLFKSLQIL